ncbi:cell division cycle and apoptosis regulator protein [Anaeramoeba flamelloides]|uniref:Cell division cycle and apoptosis regulator protein n=1 Tax=Anaeramoeba flamelloides TaxID=1746091 RepID=A0ABQ8XVS3_9EUKA|nr:cell division cycle and apoptosis regulator protein [Anaeramoeba flamelloides]
MIKQEIIKKGRSQRSKYKVQELKITKKTKSTIQNTDGLQIIRGPRSMSNEPKTQTASPSIQIRNNLPNNMINKVLLSNQSSQRQILYYSTLIQQSENTIINVKVVLFSGLNMKTEEEKKQSINKLKKIPQNSSVFDRRHISKQLKFLIFRSNGNNLSLVGGSYSSRIDGVNPQNCFLNCAKRLFLQQTGVDLNGCDFYPFFTVNYRRKNNRMERTLIFIVKNLSNSALVQNSSNLEKIIPKFNENKIKSLSSKEKEFENKIDIELDKELDIKAGIIKSDDENLTQNYLILKAMDNYYYKKKRINDCKPMLISLDGILDYNIKDTHENTFEVSLFGELFNELIQRNFALQILDFLTNFGERIKLENNDYENSLEIAFKYFDLNDKRYVLRRMLLQAFHSLSDELTRNNLLNILHKFTTNGLIFYDRLLQKFGSNL